MKLAIGLVLLATVALTVLYFMFFSAGMIPAFPHWPDGSKC